MAVKLTADDWQLYTSMKCGHVARALNARLNKLISKAKKMKFTLNDTLNQSWKLEIAEKIRDEMYELMSKYSSYGARDTEPCCVLVDTIEKELSLEEYSLER